MIKKFRKPLPQLQHLVERYWSWEGSGELPIIIAGNGLACVFHYGDPFTAKCGNEIVDFPTAHIVCPRTEKIELFPQKNIGFISIRFRHGAFRHFYRGSTGELADTHLSIEDVWGQRGKDLSERLLECSTFDQRVDMIEASLLSIVQTHNKSQSMTEFAANRLYYNTPDTRVESIADELGLSRRHLQRIFREDFGVSPKEFLQIARFNRTLRTLLMSKYVHYNEYALDNGYYDQSHFIHDFQRFVGTSPLNYLTEKNFMSHFYNTSLL